MRKRKIGLMSLLSILSILSFSNVKSNNYEVNDNKPPLKKIHIDHIKETHLKLNEKNTRYIYYSGVTDASNEETDPNKTYIMERRAASVSGLTNMVKNITFDLDPKLVTLWDSKITDESNFVSIKNREMCLVQFDGQYSFGYVDDDMYTRTHVIEYLGDVTAPIIGGTNNFVVNVNNMLSKEEIISHVKVSDETDGVIVPTIVSSTYDPTNRKPGKYNMLLRATDKSGNSSELTLTITVADIDAPTITGPSSLEYSYDAIPSSEQVIAQFKGSDNYDTTLKLDVKANTFANNGGNIGDYKIELSTTDSSNNVSANKICNIKIYDRKAPNISVKGATSDKTLEVSNVQPLSLEDLKKLITVTDEYKNGNPTYTIMGHDDYLLGAEIVGGRYAITIEAKDSSNNVNRMVFNLVVTDKKAPIFELDNYFVVLGSGVELSIDDIKRLASQVAGVSATDVKDVTISDTSNPNIKNAKLTLNDDRVISINFEMGTKINTILMKWYHYIYKWFTILFNIDTYYKTDQFFNFIPRFKSISKVYKEGYFYKF